MRMRMQDPVGRSAQWRTMVILAAIVIWHLESAAT